MEEDTFYDEGLNTKLIPKYKIAMKGSDRIEIFLIQV